MSTSIRTSIVAPARAAARDKSATGSGSSTATEIQGRSAWPRARRGAGPEPVGHGDRVGAGSGDGLVAPRPDAGQDRGAECPGLVLGDDLDRDAGDVGQELEEPGVLRAAAGRADELRLDA